MNEISAKCSKAIISKTETFSESFIAFSQSTQNLVHFEKKDQLYNLNISEVIDYQKCGYLNARKFLFYNTLQESTCSRVLTLSKSTWCDFYSKFPLNDHSFS